jgi:tRNA A-37 threonylcarbamoyl transferase component Bud32
VPEGFQGRVLKSGLARTVYVDARGAVVKRFHNPSAVQALRDRRRAAAEQRVLSALLARDLPVPRPLAVRRAGTAWEVVMERIEGAVDLGALLRGAAPVPLPLDELAARVGALLARAHLAGLDHPDLHPGNVLVDGAGRAWLVDFHKARVRPRPAPLLLGERDLVALLAYVREGLAAPARARLVAAWVEASAALPAGEGAAFAAELEARARFHRRAWVAHAEGRWLRSSSQCELHADARGELCARRGAPPEEARALLDAPARGAERRSAGSLDALVLGGLPPAELRARWCAAARLAEHGLPALAPLALGPCAAAFRVPPGAHPASALAPEQTGGLLGALHDRGLGLARLEGALWLAHGTALLAPPAHLLHVDARPGRLAPEQRFACAPAHASDPAFRRAYVAAFRGTAEESAALAAELC